MTPNNHFELLARYNQWMNEKLYQVCAEIPDQKRKEDLGAFFQSIHGTLNHLLYGDKAWMGRFTGPLYSVTVIGQNLYEQFEELREERIKTDREILEWSRSLSIDWLACPFEYTSNVDQKTPGSSGLDVGYPSVQPSNSPSWTTDYFNQATGLRAWYY
jgi:uncharacterized damage-inducible protein DinB